MEFKNKKIAFLGDSITEGVGVQSSDSIYWKQLARLTGAECFGYGISGTRIAPQFPLSNAEEDQYYGSRVDKMIPDADVIVVFGGTNDFGHGNAALGSFGDKTNDTFYGAYYCLLKQLMERYPDGQLVVITPLHRVSEDEVLYNDLGVRRCGPLSTYVHAIREVAEFFGVPVVDLYRDCRIQPRIQYLKEKYMPDGLHPNDAGHELITKCLLNVLNHI